jgi:hypothetical protein
MRFEELSKRNQNFLIEQLYESIESRAKDEDINRPIVLPYEELTRFFNAYDVGYKLVNGYPQSIINEGSRNKYLIHFEGREVLLKVIPPDDFNEED